MIFEESKLKKMIEHMRKKYIKSMCYGDQLKFQHKVEAFETVMQIHGCDFQPVKFSWSPGIGGIAEYEDYGE